MNKRILLVVLSAMGIVGCTSTPQVEPPSATPKHVSVGWIKKDWRLCKDDGTCPRPTPKTVEPSAPPVVAVVKPSRPDKEERTPQVATVREPAVVHFEFAKATPAGDWQRALETIEHQVAPSDRILIKAYTDDLGGAQYNDRLARKRAEYVVSWLKAKGVKNPMEVEAKGKCCYIASNDTEEGRAANRRAEIHFPSPKNAGPETGQARIEATKQKEIKK